MTVVDECESCTFAPTILCSEAETRYLVFVGLIQLGELGAEFVFRDIGAIGVENVTVVNETVSRSSIPVIYGAVEMVQVVGG